MGKAHLRGPPLKHLLCLLHTASALPQGDNPAPVQQLPRAPRHPTVAALTGRVRWFCWHLPPAQLQFPSCCLHPQGLIGKVNQLLSDIEHCSQTKQGQGSTSAQKGSSVSWGESVVFKVNKLDPYSSFHLPADSGNTACTALHTEGNCSVPLSSSWGSPHAIQLS